MAAFGYNNQSKMFRGITASNYQREHDAEFNFWRYEGLYPATKTEMQPVVSNGILQNFRTATFENNFGGTASENKTEEVNDG